MAKEKTYNQLRKEWYKRLEKSGFEDIEDESGNLKDHHSGHFQNNKNFHHTPEQMELVRAHYIQAEELLHIFSFPSKLHREIWRLYSEGATVREIADSLSRRRFKTASKSQVDRIIKQYQQYIK